ncbi:hypothetical protein ACTQ49_10815 [Luteococcus sp. Sow4_B9]
MSLVLLESSVPTIVYALIALAAMLLALLAVMNVGGNRPHS